MNLGKPWSGKMISDLKKVITATLGWSLSRYSDSEFLERLSRVAAMLGYSSVEDFGVHLSTTTLTQGEMEIIADFFTIGESFFFRYRSDFEVLRQTILPQILKVKSKNEPLRIWCAGCSSGEEPYTTAIYLQNLTKENGHPSLQIYATDVSAYALKKARQGLYTPWSLRDTSPEERMHYFTESGKEWQLRPELLKKVQFSYHNLADSEYSIIQSFSGKFDVIFCRNVLIYFTPENQYHVLNQFQKKLNKYGVLIVSPCESSLVPGQLYRHEIIQSTTILRPNYKTGFLQPLQTNREKNPQRTSRLKNHPVTNCDPERIKVLRPEVIARSAQSTSKIDYYAHAQLLYNEGAYESAAGVLLLLVNNPNYQYQYIHFDLLIHTLINAHKPVEALNQCDIALTHDPLSKDLLHWKATIHTELGQFDQAKSCYHKVIFLDTGNIRAHFHEALIEKQLGNISQSDILNKRIEKLLHALPDEYQLSELDNITVKEVRQMIKGIRHVK